MAREQPLGSNGANGATQPIRRISVVAPLLDEVTHVDGLVADLAGQDFTGELEVIVADGGSSDGSVERLRIGAEQHGLSLTVLENPARWVSQGLNACIRRARGDLIVRVDCHARYPRDYLRRCAIAAEETNAWNVGGVVVAKGRTLMERAVACAMDSPFGGIGWTRHASGAGRVQVDTVTYGAFRPEAFDRAGLFDETLKRNQDDEFNLRLRRSGGAIVLDPSIRTFYVPRGTLRGVFRQYYEYGFWKVPVMLRHRSVLSARSLAPLALVGSLLVVAPLAVFLDIALWLLVAEIGVYAVAALVFGAKSLTRRREPWRLLPRVVAAFAAFHVGYGVGMLAGSLRFTVFR